MASFPVNADTSKAQKSIDQLIDQLRKIGKEAKLSENQIEDMIAGIKKSSAAGQSSMGGLNNGLNKTNTLLKSVAGGFAAMVAVDKLKEFAGEIIKITAEFQKLDAVLTNTLGSKSAAQSALSMIKQTAATTPFSVVELTQAYVKLVNQGIKPTQQEIIKLGDLASSTGKGFDQLTEAIIDAQTGQFERLKEFGILANKEGDKVSFTFKGIRTQVDFTSDSIKRYLIGLGDLEGVTGAMAAISETAGGKISNMGDAWDTFMTTLGSGQSGPLVNAINNITWLIAAATEFAKTQEQVQEETEATAGTQAVEQFKSLVRIYKDAHKAYDDFYKLKVARIQINDMESESLDHNNEANFDRINAIVDENNVIRAQIQYVKDYVVSLDKEEVKKKEKAKVDAQTAAEKAAMEREEIRLLRLKLFPLREINEQEAIAKRMHDAMAKDIASKLPFVKAPEKLEGLKEPVVPINWDYINAEEKAQMEAMDSFKAYSIQAIDELFNYQMFDIQRQQAALDQKFKYEMDLAGNNENAKLSLKKKFNQQAAALQRKEDEAKKEQAVFDILVSTGPAVAKTAATLGFPLAIPFILAVGTLLALQLSRTSGVQTPRYAATGDFDIDGPGTTTSDSIPYMLSVHESVVQAERSRKFKELLQPMIENDNFDWSDARNIIDSKLPSMPSIYVKKARGADSSELINEMRATRKAIENKKETRFSFDENGFSVYQGREDSWRKYLTNRYSM